MSALISLSGGMDSATLLALAVKQFGSDEVKSAAFFYPSKHNVWELKMAHRLASYHNVDHKLINVAPLFDGFNSDLLTSGGEIPEGHYEAESMKRTVVPCRNLIFLSVLAGLAESLGVGEVWMGMHAGDHAIYADCRPDFVVYAAQAVYQATEGRVALKSPFLHDDKAAILKRGLGLGVPYQITRTCYTDGAVACGKCGSCQERLAAFRANGIPDPLEYASREIMPK